MSNVAIQIDNICKSFGEVQALKDVSLSIANGEIFGLLGPDGAGKTTLFRILTTLMLPDSGRAQVCGLDICKEYRKIRTIAGYMPGRFSLYADLSVEENLRFYASLFGGKIEDNFCMIEPIYRQLEPFKNRRAGALSGGMKQKLALCCSLIHRPETLFLDEPTTGVDAVSRSEFWDILAEIRNGGMPVFVSTPYMDEASRCNRIALINNGKILETGSLDEIMKRNRLQLVAVKGRDNYATLEALRGFEGVERAYLSGEYIHAAVTSSFDRRGIMTTCEILDLKDIDANIEDVFIKIMSDENG